ncbi:helix-turn-helix transcriptional regulator [Acidovorax sp. ACV02]|uniref:S24 family peptidase n=1 Tax=Acidovorax sp. ACV02 TaxID=2769310 RepID=UPI00177AA651|nr:helix-turn-helix transcriptional regulator [Acidovorax sp. ACV02]MBD9406257.1 helix-turn-helix transcriptional regulator [Acidovorax sp. ACV02]
MDALTLHRKARLQALIDGKPWEGNQAQFALAAGVTKARITQLLDPSDSFGERAAKNIADKLELPDRFFEAGFHGVMPDREKELAQLMSALGLEVIRLTKADLGKLPEWVRNAAGAGRQFLPDFIVSRKDLPPLFVTCKGSPHLDPGDPVVNGAQKLAATRPREFMLVDLSNGVGDAAQSIRAAVLTAAPEAPAPRELQPPSVPGETVGDFAAVRRADVRFSNGTGQVVYEEDDKPPLVFRVDFLRKLGIKNGDAVVVDSVGISNEPKIPDGAVVLVNRGDRERLNGDLFAFRVDGELLIKRLERIDGVGILATADNPNFKPKQKVYASVIDFEVIGRAVWTGALL